MLHCCMFHLLKMGGFVEVKILHDMKYIYFCRENFRHVHYIGCTEKSFFSMRYLEGARQRKNARQNICLPCIFYGARQTQSFFVCFFPYTVKSQLCRAFCILHMVNIFSHRLLPTISKRRGRVFLLFPLPCVFRSATRKDTFVSVQFCMAHDQFFSYICPPKPLIQLPLTTNHM
jgi:hypothetical protein